MPKPQMRVFIVNVTSPNGDPMYTLHANRIEAAYYKTEDGFTTFKDDQHADVFTVRNDCLVTVERTDAPVDERAAVFLQLLERADSAGSAAGDIETSETLPDGREFRTGYRVTVTTQGSVDEKR
jgi:hypothetical protein